MKKFLFVIQYDSFCKTLVPVITFLVKKNFQCDVILLKQKFYKRPWLSDNILSLFDNIKSDLNSFNFYTNRKTLQIIKDINYDVITIGTSYTYFIEKLYKVLKQYNLKSKIVTGYVGALLKNNIDGFIKGVKRRSYSDLIWVPGIESKNQILSLNMINSEKTKISVTGLPRFDRLYNELESIKKENKTEIIFFEQPTFPKTKQERILLVEKLIKFAQFKKEDSFLIKPRFDAKVGHAHRPKYLLQDIFNKIKNKPKNIQISNDDIYDLFKKCKLSLTISSTAGLESLLCRIPTFFIKDFCKNKNFYGSNDFNEFNALVSFDDLYNDNLPKINYKPILNTLRFDGQNTRRLTKEIIFLSETIKS